MGISYKKLWVLLIEKDVTRAQMRRDLKIATGTISKLNKGEEVALSVLLRICEYLNCDIGDICSVVKPRKEDCV
jgi:DNA-binding Xre family transcriptional regulator